MNNCDKAAELLLSLSKEELSKVIYHSSIGKTIILKLENNKAQGLSAIPSAISSLATKFLKIPVDTKPRV